MRRYLLQMAGLGLAATPMWSGASIAAEIPKSPEVAADRHFQHRQHARLCAVRVSRRRRQADRHHRGTRRRSRQAARRQAGHPAHAVPVDDPGAGGRPFQDRLGNLLRQSGASGPGRFRDVRQSRHRGLHVTGEAADLHGRQPALRQAHRRLGRHRIRFPGGQAQRRMRRQEACRRSRSRCSIRRRISSRRCCPTGSMPAWTTPRRRAISR